MNAESTPLQTIELPNVDVMPPTPPLGLRARFGKAAGVGLLLASSTVTAYTAEQAISPGIAEAAYDASTGNYPWAAADHVSMPPATDNITWGYTDKAACDNSSAEYNCGTHKEGSYHVYDQFGAYLRNCTSYTAWRVAMEYGVNPSGMGSGKYWDENASGKGWTVREDNTSPEVGDVAVWQETISNPSGHVAFVEEVIPQTNGPKKVRIAEYNQQLDGKFRNDRLVVADSYIDINGANASNFKLKVMPETTHSTPVGWPDPTPTVVQRGNETAMVVVDQGKGLDYYFNPDGGGVWDRIDIPDSDTKSTPAAVVRPGGELNIAAQGDDGSLDFYYNPLGVNTWGKMEIAGPNSAYSAPSIIQRPSGETNIVVQGPNNTLDFYYNAQGNPNWGKMTVPGGQAYSRPAVVQRPSGETTIAVLGPNNSMDFYYNAAGSPHWGRVPVATDNWAMSAPSMVQRPDGETVIATQGPNHSLDIYINAQGHPAWGRINAAGANTTFNDTNPPPTLLRPSGEIDVAIHGPGNSASIYYNAQGNPNWGQSLAAIPGYAFREPTMIQRSTGETDLVIVGPDKRLDFYMNDQGSPYWATLRISGDNSIY